jgi:hypothetical protein
LIFSWRIKFMNCIDWNFFIIDRSSFSIFL